MKIKLDKADVVFSEFIRKRAILNTGGCEFCGTPKYDITKEDGSIFPAWKQLQCSHFIGRRKKSVRYDPNNASGLCFTCHQELGANPYLHNEFFRKRLGSEGWEKLIIRSNIPTKPDKEKILEELKAKLRDVEESVDKSIEIG